MTASKLTSTSMATMRRCPRQFFYRYDMGLRRLRDTAPLRLGSAFHHGQELRRGLFADDLAAVIDLATAGYAEMPDWAEPDAWAVECETVRQLLAGHFWRYGDDNLEFVAVELPFDIPLVNPDSGAASRTFRLAGKIDAVHMIA